MHKLQLTMLPGEYWYGGHTNYGYLMPVNAKKVMLVDTTVVRSYGQANTLFVSNKGRVIWSEAGFKTRFVFGRITCTGRKAKIGLYQADDHTLRGRLSLCGGSLYAAGRHLPGRVNVPHSTVLHLDPV